MLTTTMLQYAKENLSIIFTDTFSTSKTNFLYSLILCFHYCMILK